MGKGKTIKYCQYCGKKIKTIKKTVYGQYDRESTVYVPYCLKCNEEV